MTNFSGFFVFELIKASLIWPKFKFLNSSSEPKSIFINSICSKYSSSFWNNSSLNICSIFLILILGILILLVSKFLI